MTQSFGKFLTQIKTDSVAKSSHYYVDLGIPRFMSSNYTNNDLNKISLYVEQTQFPEFALATNPARVDGLTAEMPYDKLYGIVGMTFICDRDMLIKEFFDRWSQGIVLERGGSFRYFNDYIIPKLSIHQLDENKQIKYTCNLYDVYPKVVNDILVSSGAKDYMRFQVQFTYRYWDSSRSTSLIPVGAAGNSSIVNYTKALDSGRSGENVPGKEFFQRLFSNSSLTQSANTSINPSPPQENKFSKLIQETAKSFEKNAIGKFFK